MKTILLFSFFCLGTLSFAQKKEYDEKMIGCYKGSEQNQQIDGMSKYWISCRLEGGKSILLFVAVNTDGEVMQTTENGTWWTENGKYYELHKVDNVTDVYEYQPLDNGDVKFKSLFLLGKKDDSYEFTDYKISDD
ncbi:MAG: hypothetical protein K0M56_10050 [Kaistella sp.]|nr:hypothetical protein [Kaistella sp.]